MATAQETIDAIDAWIASTSALFVSKQQAHFLVNGRYWQGLNSHTTPPAHVSAGRNDVAADRRTQKPGYETQAWKDFLPELDGVPVPFSATVDQYVEPDGTCGCIIHREFTFDGATYQSSQNYFGTEDYRTKGWTPL